MNREDAKKMYQVRYVDPKEVYGYILGLESAILCAERYKGIDMKNFIGEIQEMIESARAIKGYAGYCKERERKNDR